MKQIFLITVLLVSSLSIASCKNNTEKKEHSTTVAQKTNDEGNTKIQVALLLDTSNSMDGLIEQAKARLWNIVNTLTTLKYNGKTPDIEIGLYEYGNDGLSAETNFIRKVAPLTTDLDLISEKLFSLKTNGGNEYCGAVIQDATTQLQWDDNKTNMKLIYICGNEAFNQGNVNYKKAIADALKTEIYINTIFCGNTTEGVKLLWKDGANGGQGKYFNIDSNKVIEYIPTPYDDEITRENEKMNTTYVGYGMIGDAKKISQVKEDNNAKGISKANYAERAVSKSKAVYKNDTWDLVDKAKKDKAIVDKLKAEELPAELKNKSKEEIKIYIENKSKERENIQKQIGELAKKRQAYIETEAKKSNKQDDLGGAINSSIVTFAKTKGYTVE